MDILLFCVILPLEPVRRWVAFLLKNVFFYHLLDIKKEGSLHSKGIFFFVYLRMAELFVIFYIISARVQSVTPRR